MNGRKMLLGTNLKMYKTASQTEKYLTELAQCTADINRDQVTFFVNLSYLAIPSASQLKMKSPIVLGAQNMCWEDQGEFTGEISPVMLKEFNVEVIEIAHSERRKIFGETDSIANQKMLAALRHGFKALLCVGENHDQKENKVVDAILQIQLQVGLKNVKPEDLDRIWIAYEPGWAIGVNGEPATGDYVGDRHDRINRILIEMFGERGGAIPKLYGGSVNLKNAKEFIEQTHVDGLFVGRAAWDAEHFSQLAREVLPLWGMKVKGDN